MSLFLGIDWGGTYLKAGLVDSRGKIIKKKVYSSASLKKKEIFLKEIKHLLEKFHRSRIKAVGIGAPGIIDTDKGFIYYLPNISGWKNYPLKVALEKRLQLPVFIDNDANLFGLAEFSYGAAKDKSNGIFLTIGTGLGGAVVVKGKLLEGKTSASELGHIPIDLRGKACGCGARGCIETYVGNNYLLARYKQLKKNNTIIDVEEIFKRGLQKERAALLLWKEFSYNLGRFLAGMVNIFNPEVIVLGGGISGAFRLFKPSLKETIKQYAMWPQVKGLKLIKAKLKDPGIIGAALLARQGG
jgi:glucokinase